VLGGGDSRRLGAPEASASALTIRWIAGGNAALGRVLVDEARSRAPADPLRGHVTGLAHDGQPAGLRPRDAAAIVAKRHPEKKIGILREPVRAWRA
jgi:hypothetical protein